MDKKRVTIELKDNLLQRDIENLVRTLVTFRHNLMHYNYDFFENLFDKSNPDIKFENNIIKKLNKTLDLNIFRDLGKFKDFKEENKTNYFEDSDVFRIFGKERRAKKLYTAYNILCNRKSGFNNFINSFFISDGEENQEFKELITAHFNNEEM